MLHTPLCFCSFTGVQKWNGGVPYCMTPTCMMLDIYMHYRLEYLPCLAKKNALLRVAKGQESGRAVYEGLFFIRDITMKYIIRPATSLRSLPCTVRVFCAKLLRR